MKKYKYEKYQVKPGKKVYVFSQHDGDDWSGPVIEHFAKEHATKIGIYTADKKYLFEVSILNEEGTEYTVKLCRDGVPNGAMIVMMKETLYFGKYFQRDGFNGVVYRFKNDERVWLQEYKHGMLVDECLTDVFVHEAVGMPMPFDCFFENEEVIERKRKSEKGQVIEYVAGDPTGHHYVLGASIDKDGLIRIGQFKNNAFNGLVLEVADDHYSFSRFCDGKPSQDFVLTIVPAFGGYSFVLPRDDGSSTNLVYCEEGHKMKMMIQYMAGRMTSNGRNEICLPDFIDPDAPKPHQQAAQKKPENKVKPNIAKTAEDRLNEMIGLEKVKAELAKMKAMLSKKPDKALGMNMVFLGNPGTGKTEVARLLAQILYDEGILPSSKVVETDRSGLVAEYIGKTAIKTHSIVNSALGGVLFIDEAYSLEPNSSGDFSKEAIDTLIADMENYRGKMCFILAGYEKPMMHMLDTNKGFKSRIQRFIHFDNYSQDELRKIAEYRLQLDGYQTDNDVLDEVAKLAYSRSFADDFANAREVRNILERLYEIQAIRTSDVKDDLVITMADIEEYKKKDKPAMVSDLTAEERLHNLVGLEDVKKQIMLLKAMLAKSKGDLGKTNLNMCFYGNPGTGKTEVARLLADILYDEGILPERKYTEIDASGLIGLYVGHTGPKTHQVVKDSLGGVLFIDEAYSLANVKGDCDYGKEAIDALIADMENYRGKLCIVLAGYKEPMEYMMSLNPGFKSRINRNIVFPDYSHAELMQIASMMLESKKYTMADDAFEEFSKVVGLLQGNTDFGNARGVRNILESIFEIQALRTYNEKISDSSFIKLVDIQEYEKDHGIVFAPMAKKHDFHLCLADFESIADSYDEGSFVYDSDFIQQVSVNIKIEQQGKITGEGSGFIVSPKGIIATCAHIAGKADSMTVIVNIKTATGKFISKDYKAETIAYNAESDVALIGIISSEIEFPCYPLAKPNQPFPALLTEIAMGGYPFGGSRFEQITITEGKIQSINKDSYSGKDRINVYVDLAGHPGSSGSGVIDKKTGRCIGVFAGAAVGGSGDVKLTINYAVPTAYLWSLIKEVCAEPKQNVKSISADNEMPDLKLDKLPHRSEGLNNELIPPRPTAQRLSNIHIVKGDISTFEGDAVVNAANSRLSIGGGVCGAIFKKAGAEKLAIECAKVAPCPVGSAVATSGCNMPVNLIIHAVGPRYDTDKNPERLLSNAYESVFAVARKNGVKSIALPSISTGIYGFPSDLAAPIAMREIVRASSYMDDIYLYCFDDRTFNIYQRLLDRLG